MIYSRRVLLREKADDRIWGDVLVWLGDRHPSKWHRVSDAAPDLPLAPDQLQRLWNQWADDGWLERSRNPANELFRPVEITPLFKDVEMSEQQAWAQYFSALRRLRLR